MARIMSYQPETPLPFFSADFQSSLMHHLLSEKRYSDAIKVAKISDFSDESENNTSMIQSILSEEGLSDLERAEMLWEYGDKLRLTIGGAAWRESLNSAADLYNTAGHVSGALDIRIDLIQYHRDESASIVDDTAELWQIMAKMESVGNWSSVNRCLGAIININTGEFLTPPEALQVKVEEEWLRVTDICSRGPAGGSVSIVKILEWQSLKPKTARGLDYLEHFYRRIEDCDAPAMISLVLTTLFDLYTSIGDDAKAVECLSRRPEVLPRQLMAMLGTDPFETALKAVTEAPDTESELKILRDELQNVQAIIRRTPTMSARASEVERLCNLCHVYITQYTFRGYEQVERLASCFDTVIEQACEQLDDWQATIWRAKALQNRAFIPQIKSQTAKTMDELQAFSREALQYYQQALDLFEASGHSQNWRAMSAKTYVANSRKLLWQLEQRPAVSDNFTTAARLYAEAVESGPLNHQQTTCLNLLRLWVEGHQAGVEVDPAVFQPSSSYEMALKWANEADRLANIQRNDLSALPRERAVLAKQLMSSKRDPKTDFHMIALLLHDSADDNVGAWNWLQRSKARSISDMLGLGINIPMALKHLIDADANLIDICAVEQTLAREIDTANEDRQFLLRKKLESHRAEMKQNPILKQLLDYREGQPTSLERLQSISVKTPPQPARRIFYVDWLFYEDHCFAFIASSSGVDVYLTGVTGTQVAQWKAQYLGDGFSKAHSLDSPEIEPLQKLSQLIQEVVKRTEPKDILVFCPSGVLHGVPLHAATLSDDSRKCLLERNPVVYTASMTTFEQCVSKEAERELLSDQTSRSYVAVYERTETEALSETQMVQRDMIYAKVREVAEKRRPVSVTAFGSEVTRERLVAAFEADYMYFFGHCESSASNMLLQGLVLDDPARGHRDVFTASDMFAIDVKTSCLTLIACGSANEVHSQGDEPLGIVSALLCAGATSVIGTMWKVQVGTARVFTEVLDGNLNTNGGGLVDLAVAVQKTALRLKARREGGTQHPYHWAAFVLHGSWFMSRRGLAGLSFASA
ncbi:hypothetical protein BR93DRAFT_208319 [Coniochaeta sp. PMI_546]|nr:hypothetical protein BR93DRAFT_208319 [Coniochaeta sp. PMI_546]